MFETSPLDPVLLPRLKDEMLVQIWIGIRKYPSRHRAHKSTSSLCVAQRTGAENAASLSDRWMSGRSLLFENFHAAEIAQMSDEGRNIVRLENPTLPAGTVRPDTSWWRQDNAIPH